MLMPNEQDAMHSGCYVVSPHPDAEHPTDIKFQLAASVPVTIPNEQLLLIDEVNDTLTVIRILFESDENKFLAYFKPLISLAQAGLVGPNAQPEAAYRSLVKLRSDITAREAGNVKNRYMRKLGGQSLLWGGVALALGLFIKTILNIQVAGNFFILWSGCMAGVWLSFGARKNQFTFDDLAIPEKDRLEPIVRLAFAGLLTTILGLSFSLEGFVVQLGKLSSTEINSSGRVSLLIGMLCGFSEQALGLKVSQEAARFLRVNAEVTKPTASKAETNAPR